MLRSKNLTKILSLLIAIGLWAYVTAVENPPTTERIRGIPVELMNLKALTQNGFVVLEGDNAMVEVLVTGTRSDITKYKDQILATADVFGYRAGESYVNVVVLPPPQLKCTEIKPSKIRVNIENLVSVYKPVNIVFTGEPEPDTEPGNMIVQPEQIEVKGPKSLVESVSNVGVEVPYSRVSRAGATLTLEALALDSEGEIVEKVNLSSTTVSVSATLYDIKTVPLEIEITGQLDEKYEMTNLDVPETIKIRGSKSALADIDSVAAEPIDISEVEISSELPVKLLLPPGVELAGSSRDIYVVIGIKGISNRSFEYFSQEVELRGLKEGWGAYINTPSLILKVAGMEETLDSAVKEDFILYVDLAGLEEGTYMVPVVVLHDKPLNNLEVIPAEVHVTINGEV